MEYLREKLKADLGITDEQYNELVRQARAESTVKNDIDNVGEMSAMQAMAMNDVGMMTAVQAQAMNDIAQQVAMLLFRIMQLEARK